jgi:hypothetical protein
MAHTTFKATSWSSAAAWPASSPPTSACGRPARDPGGPRHARAPRRPGPVGLWWHGPGGHAVAGAHEDPRHPRTRPADWLRFGESNPDETSPPAMGALLRGALARQVYDWLQGEGLKFMPAVNWVERGMHGDGNSLPRYHIVWGTARELTRCMIHALRASRHRRMPDAAAPPPYHPTAATRRTSERRRGGDESNGARDAPARPSGGAGHGRHQRQPRGNPRVTGPKSTAPCPPPCSTAPTRLLTAAAPRRASLGAG